MKESKTKNILNDIKMERAVYQPPRVGIVFLKRSDIITASGEYDTAKGDNLFDYENLFPGN